MSGLYRRRRVRNSLFLGLSVVATILGLGALALILGELLYEGFTGLDLALFTQSTPPPGEPGGLLNAIVGTLIMTSMAVLVGTPELLDESPDGILGISRQRLPQADNGPGNLSDPESFTVNVSADPLTFGIVYLYTGTKR